ncbi:MAG TPA: hypothetical protein VGS97_10450 [Actinocrinis sp.]|uniref:hypothetical protein n=1 Tax=Actinocrinis sp. TaxID=1920516 RepID=UPI002DDD6AE1|nr:hypothetical protein [Actinocrinis sp.]HEV2344501.1 hypothetical protein [Actinocrinis sp.]
MYEPALAEPVADTVPTLAEAVLAAYRAGVTEGRSAVVHYAPTTITVNHAPAPAPVVQDAPMPTLPAGPDQAGPPALVKPAHLRRRYSRADLFVFLGGGILAGACVQAALAGFLYTTGLTARLWLCCTVLTGVPLLGGLLLLGAAAVTSRQERER